jgi:hypothetical protein
VDGIAYPCTGLRPIAASRGDRAYLPDAILSFRCSRLCRLSVEGKLPGHRYLMKSLFTLIPVLLNIHMVNHFYQAVFIPWQSHDDI